MGYYMRISYSAIGILIGIVGCGLGIYFNNINAAIWAGLSTLYAILLCGEHYYRHNANTLVSTKVSDHSVFMIAGGAIGCIAGLSSFITYVTIAAVSHESFNGRDHIIASIWAFITFKWALSMLVNGYRYYTHSEESPMSYKVKLSYSVLGAVIGFSVFLVFGVIHHCWHSACWGFGSGLVALFLSLEHIYRYRHPDKLLAHLSCLFVLSLLFMAAGFTGLCTYLCKAAILKQHLTMDSYWLAAVWAAMVLKWGFSIMWNVSYWRSIGGSYAPIINSEESSFYDGS